MAVRIGINGFGRIGRYLVRLMAQETGYEVAMVNARADNETLAHLLKYDSVHGTYPGEVKATENGFTVDGNEIIVTRHPIGEWTWKDGNVDLVIETTGRVKDKAGLSKHIECGAKKAIISAPGKDVDLTVVMGVNHDLYDSAKHDVVSSASCTTNCMAPAVKLIHDAFGIKHGQITTVHSYTMSQRILDGSHSDLRRGRAAAMSIVPTTTGAAKAVTMVIPELKGKLDGMSMRVPTPNVSLVDMVCELEKSVTAEEVNALLKEAAAGSMQGYMGYSEIPLVSVDYTGNENGGVVDGLLTSVMNGTQLKLIIWYDNESGFTNQLMRFIKLIGKDL
ncbi:type I glyceraldehyde-3-phosphate dehydrogenase [Desulfovibrio ferrophilus]|uniref:Glyceraldehyde-3-phosphate dehydrogenase n=1 Tax=Desulfovibrio ferrophilus TaxID=241368 RepID=A0A2Z6B075_9BACT|nr:type I glyceraldehyde-3-phosphate dehydrogenase [Desulfovibrio ferrophilus]BBD08919.1 glyceraldehyde-3-phosphate dehydrogenase [Desulfovibrio ferrophilus]